MHGRRPIPGSAEIAGRRPEEGCDGAPSAAEEPDTVRSPVEWSRLYRELGEPVFRMIHRMTGDSHRAEDLTHDTFIRVYERSGQYSGRGSLRSWVFGIARNLVREDGRNRTRRLRLLDEQAPGSGALPDGVPETVTERLELEAALARLPEGQRVALLLHVVDGYGHAEIGEMLEIAEGSSKARVSRAKAALKKFLGTTGV